MTFPKFKTKEEVPEQFASLYHEVNGEWVYNEPEPEGGGITQKDLDDVRNTLAKVREEFKEEKDSHKATAKKLADLERAEAAKGAGIEEEKLKELETKIRADIEREKAAEIAELQKKLEDREEILTENRALKLDSKIKDTMVKNGVLPEAVDDIFRLSSSEYDLTDAGNPVLTNHPAKAIDVFVKEDLAKRYPWAFKGSQGDGGGAGGGMGRPGDSGVATADQILANPGAALQAAREAGQH